MFQAADLALQDVAISPDGRRALTCAGGDASFRGFDFDVRLFDLDNGEETRRFRGNTHVDSVAFSPDGRRALTCSDTIRVWDVEEGEEIARSERNIETSDRAGAGVFLPGGQSVVYGARGDLHIWDFINNKDQ